MGRATFEVLVVDDEPHTVRQYRSYLRDSGSRVRAVDSIDRAETAIKEAAERGATFDLVLLDLVLEDGHGLSLLPALLALKPQPTIAVVSGYLDAETTLDLMPDCSVILPKPATRNDVLRLLEMARNETKLSGETLVEEFATRHALSPQQARLLECAITRRTAEEAAEIVGVAVGTVHSYWHRIAEKLGCRTRRDAVAMFLEFVLERMGVPGFDSSEAHPRPRLQVR